MASETVEDKKSEEEAPVEEIKEPKAQEKEENEDLTKIEELELGKPEISEKEREGEVEGEGEGGGGGGGGGESEAESKGDSEGEDETKGESKVEPEDKNAAEGYERKEESVGDDERTEEAKKIPKEKARRGRKKSGERKKETTLSLKEPVTPVSDRPTRQRKTVERYSVMSPAMSARSSAGKGLSIEKGSGTPLKDIPNVAFKLSKRKADDNLQVLHTILFGKKAKVHNLKRNINQFSGYAWVEHEKEKQRGRIKEKLDKCVKERLMDFCDVLNVRINKAGIKKEELSAKLLEFLESPHETTDILLADKEQKSQKRKRKVAANKAIDSGETSIETAKKKQRSQSGKSKRVVSKVEEEDEIDEKVGPSDEKSCSHEEEDEDKADELKKESDNEESKLEDEKLPKQMPTADNASKKTVKVASRSMPKEKAAAASTKKDTSTKIAKTKERSVKSPSTVAKDQGKGRGRGRGKGKSSKRSKVDPTKEEMHSVVVNILKDVDFNTATLSDILRQLGAHFGVDLMHRKAEVKDIITEVISNMSDEEGDEAEENAGDGDSEKDEDEDDNA